MGTIISFVRTTGKWILRIWINKNIFLRKKRLSEPDEHEVFLGSDSY